MSHRSPPKALNVSVRPESSVYGSPTSLASIPPILFASSARSSASERRKSRTSSFNCVQDSAFADAGDARRLSAREKGRGLGGIDSEVFSDFLNVDPYAQAGSPITPWPPVQGDAPGRPRIIHGTRSTGNLTTTSSRLSAASKPLSHGRVSFRDSYNGALREGPGAANEGRGAERRGGGGGGGARAGAGRPAEKVSEILIGDGLPLPPPGVANAKALRMLGPVDGPYSATIGSEKHGRRHLKDAFVLHIGNGREGRRARRDEEKADIDGLHFSQTQQPERRRPKPFGALEYKLKRVVQKATRQKRSESPQSGWYSD